MNGSRHACHNCGRILNGQYINTAMFVPCPLCSKSVMVREYPAVEGSGKVDGARHAIRTDEQAGCYYHPKRTAEEVCAGCGRFICALCVVELKGQRLCPACLRQGVEQDPSSEIVQSHMRYDKVAMLLALVPILFWPLTIVTGPAALYMVARHWKRPVSLVTRGRIRLAIAALIGLVQTSGWLFLFAWLLSRRFG